VLAVSHEPASAAKVRRSLADDLSAHAIPQDCVDDIVLVASELVGNAVVHAAGSDEASDRLDISWDIEPDAVVIRVLDGSPSLPRRRSSDARAKHGRGLSIVAAIALDWGVRRNGSGKLVWARVPIATDS
jgi:anti-sigma regulatory factor (Ser/Thr protein kinase)